MNLDVFDYAESRGFGEIHLKVDQKTGLRAIIAIHNTKFGPALGGCRCISYHNSQEAFIDAMRLARGMSYKSALIDIPHGGGKTVIMKPDHISDRQAFFRAYGEFLNSLNGRYITAVDSGTTVEDMDSIGEVSSYVTSLSTMNGETSNYTAKGVLRGIEAAVKHYLNKETLDGIRVAIQGVGNVGYFLAKLLHEAGASLTVTDVNQVAVERCVDEFKAHVVAINDIYAVDCDVFSPCALGAVINDDTLAAMKASIIAGSANNQLAIVEDGRKDYGRKAYEQGIHYVPDYVINSGGLIYAAGKYDNVDESEIVQKITGIYDALMSIFERSKRDEIAASVIADTMAEEKLA